MYCTIIIVKVIFSPDQKKKLDRQFIQRIGSYQVIKLMCLSTNWQEQHKRLVY